jgi:hypothetical protein
VILVDTNVLVDVIVPSVWTEWSQRALADARFRDQLIINAVVYAELAAGYRRIEDLEELLAQVEIDLAPIPRSALFLAGKAFRRYRAAGGIRTGVLPDFFIGAHAQVNDAPLLTRDSHRYRTYFPAVQLIAPNVS